MAFPEGSPEPHPYPIVTPPESVESRAQTPPPAAQVKIHLNLVLCREVSFPFFSFVTTPLAYGSSLARDPKRAAAAVDTTAEAVPDTLH